MWAQLVISRIQPGKQDQLQQLAREAQGMAGGSGPQRIIVCQNQNDPEEYYTLAIFPSEEQAREYERGAEQQNRYQQFQEVFQGTPRYVDMNVVFERG